MPYPTAAPNAVLRGGTEESHSPGQARRGRRAANGRIYVPPIARDSRAAIHQSRPRRPFTLAPDAWPGLRYRDAPRYSRYTTVEAAPCS